MKPNEFRIRNAKSSEFDYLGNLMGKVYSQLDGFANITDQPEYYKMLLNIGKLTEKDNTELIIVESQKGKIVGAVLYFSDMKNYGSGGTATQIKNTSGFRLLAVDPNQRGRGLGKILINECINRAKKLGQKQIVIHSTKSMKIARAMYKKIGFVRYKDIDFNQGELPVFGFKLKFQLKL